MNTKRADNKDYNETLKHCEILIILIKEIPRELRSVILSTIFYTIGSFHGNVNQESKNWKDLNDNGDLFGSPKTYGTKTYVSSPK